MWGLIQSCMDFNILQAFYFFFGGGKWMVPFRRLARADSLAQVARSRADVE